MELKIKKLKENARIPQRATNGSAGMDLYACIDSSVTLAPGQLAIIPTRFGEFQELHKSFGALRRSVVPSCRYLPHKAPFERVAQMVIAPVLTPDIVETDELSDTARGEGGFGSSGRK